MTTHSKHMRNAWNYMIRNQINFEHDCDQRKTPLLLELLPSFELSQYLLGWAIELELKA